MHERIQLCSDPQTEFVLARQSLGVSRVNHILRVHGHRLLSECEAVPSFGELAKHSLDRLFPGLTDLSHIQASLSVRQGGLGCRLASEVARSVNLAGLIATKPLVISMISDTAKASLLD